MAARSKRLLTEKSARLRKRYRKQRARRRKLGSRYADRVWLIVLRLLTSERDAHGRLSRAIAAERRPRPR